MIAVRRSSALARVAVAFATLAVASVNAAQMPWEAKLRGAIVGPGGEDADLIRILSSVHAGSDQDLLHRSSKIAASMAPSFQALPKNKWGRMAGPGVRHLVQTYFSRERGWQLHGLGPH